MSIRDHIAQMVLTALAQAQRQGNLPAVPAPEVAVERPQNPEHGDFATSLPLRLARASRVNPMRIAETLVPLIPTGQELARVWAAPPGFINVTLSDAWLQQQVAAIVAAGSAFGNVDVGQGTSLLLEFVSVNPTGPMHVGHTRGAVIGSSLAQVLRAAGFRVSTEYYINDAGSQMDAFYRSLWARYLQAHGRQAELPPNGYVGDYLVELAQELKAQEGDRYLRMPEEQAIPAIGKVGIQRMLRVISDDLAAIGVTFDTWFSEQSLFDGSQYATVMRLLEEKGCVVEREGARMFMSDALGEDRDNVLVRRNGLPTYFASDIAYHYHKFVERGFQRGINIWGADHQGHVGRLKAAIAALDIDPDRLHVIIVQLVALKRAGEAVRASKRKGQIVTLRELVDEVGPDACRYFFLARTPETQMEFDLELATRQSNENPVYYVQYAHARMAGILRNAQERNLDWSNGDLALLTHPTELALLRKMVALPEIVEAVARTLSPHPLPHYAVELATAFHWFYENCRVLSEHAQDLPISLARLRLVEACRTVMARVLGLMLMSAPERM